MMKHLKRAGAWSARLLVLICAGAAAAAAADFAVGRAEWSAERSELTVSGTGVSGVLVTVRDAANGAALGSVAMRRGGDWRLRVNPPAVPCRITAEHGGQILSRDVARAPQNCGGSSGAGASHAGRFSAYEGTRTCLQCHEQQALDVHASVHYQWKGDSRDVLDNPEVPSGKSGSINDFCIYPDINWIGKLLNVDGREVDGGCARCHAGLGLKPAPVADRAQLENIDCLVCHAPAYKRKVDLVQGVYRFVPDLEKMPVTLLQAASDIRRPSRDTCLGCHAFSGGGDNYKRGDLEDAHRNPERSFDVHMSSREAGGAGLTCLDCHRTRNHRIAGRGTDLRPRDSADTVSCAGCHTAAPHGSARLDGHARRIHCSVCHIPAYAKKAATDMHRDWSAPAELDERKRLYDPYMLKMTNVVPQYRFFNGKSYFYDFGTAARPGPSGRILMSGPAGDINDPAARIHAFKLHWGTQPIDPASLRLLPLKIGIFFSTGNLQSAIEQGAAGVGWTYTGHDFAETERYMGLFHEVAPKEDALSCSSCHGGNRMDFDLLGYTPKTEHDGRPLCASCHEDKSGEWNPAELFQKVHQKHVTDKHLDCSSCHGFSAAR